MCSDYTDPIILLGMQRVSPTKSLGWRRGRFHVSWGTAVRVYDSIYIYIHDMYGIEQYFSVPVRHIYFLRTVLKMFHLACMYEFPYGLQVFVLRARPLTSSAPGAHTCTYRTAGEFIESHTVPARSQETRL